jgi:hypothetical protein
MERGGTGWTGPWRLEGGARIDRESDSHLCLEGQGASAVRELGLTGLRNAYVDYRWGAPEFPDDATVLMEVSPDAESWRPVKRCDAEAVALRTSVEDGWMPGCADLRLPDDHGACRVRFRVEAGGETTVFRIAEVRVVADEV